jgi:hypothetical protein
MAYVRLMEGKHRPRARVRIEMVDERRFVARREIDEGQRAIRRVELRGDAPDGSTKEQ